MVVLAIFVLSIIFLVYTKLIAQSFTYLASRGSTLVKKPTSSKPEAIVISGTFWSRKFRWSSITASPELSNPTSTRDKKVKDIEALAKQHKVGEILYELIQEDGAGSWPPNANHEMSVWPPALRPYMDIYLEMAPLLPQKIPSLDDKVNTARISAFRQRFRNLLCERVNLIEVIKVRALYKQFVPLTHWFNSSCKQPTQADGMRHPVMFITPFTAALHQVDMHTGGLPSQ